MSEDTEKKSPRTLREAVQMNDWVSIVDLLDADERRAQAEHHEEQDYQQQQQELVKQICANLRSTFFRAPRRPKYVRGRPISYKRLVLGQDLVHAISNIVKKIVKLHPQMARDDFMLQHIMTDPKIGCDESIVRAFLDAFPDALTHADKNGNLPLHVACNHFDWKKVENFPVHLLTNAISVGTPNFEGYLPIALPFKYGDHVYDFVSEVILGSNGGRAAVPAPFESMLRANPESIYSLLKVTVDQTGSVEIDAEEPLLPSATYLYARSLLIAAYPQGLTQTYGDTRDWGTPLHHCCAHAKYFFSDDVLSVLLDYCSDCAKSRNSVGDIPLHTATKSLIKNRSDGRDAHCHVFHDIYARNFLDSLIGSYPETLMEKDAEGMTPLLFACSEKTSNLECEDEVMISLLGCSTNIRAVNIPDPHGRLPLHLYLEKESCSIDVVSAMIQAHPGALSVPDPKSHRLPFITMCMSASKLDTNALYIALRQFPPALFETMGTEGIVDRPAEMSFVATTAERNDCGKNLQLTNFSFNGSLMNRAFTCGSGPGSTKTPSKTDMT